MLAFSGAAFAQAVTTTPATPTTTTGSAMPNHPAFTPGQNNGQWEQRKAEFEKRRAEREARMQQLKNERDQLIAWHEQQNQIFRDKMQHLKEEGEQLLAQR
jgi:hypothetical protein